LQEHVQMPVKHVAGTRRFKYGLSCLIITALVAIPSLSGCGGGGGGGGSSTPPPPTVTVSGLVSDNFTGMGAPNVTVTIQGQARPKTVTAGDGSYTLSGVPENTTVTLLFENLQTCESETFQVTTGTTDLSNEDPPAMPFSLTDPNGCVG